MTVDAGPSDVLTKNYRGIDFQVWESKEGWMATQGEKPYRFAFCEPSKALAIITAEAAIDYIISLRS